MDVAAFQRLQRRMESRGRSASRCGRGHRCSCSPQRPRTYGHTGAASPPLSPAVQSWLLQRVEGVEVDITSGDTEHRRMPPRCRCRYSCCNEFQHFSHTPREGVDGATAVDSCVKRLRVPRGAAAAPPLCGGSTITPGEELLGEPPSEASTQATLQRRPLFYPAKASLMLSSFFRHEDSPPVADKLPSVDEKFDRAEVRHDGTQSIMLHPTLYDGASSLFLNQHQQRAASLMHAKPHSLGHQPAVQQQQQDPVSGIPLEVNAQSPTVPAHTNVGRMQQQAAASVMDGSRQGVLNVISNGAVPATSAAYSASPDAAATTTTLETATHSPNIPVGMSPETAATTAVAPVAPAAPAAVVAAIDGDTTRVTVPGTTTQPMAVPPAAMEIAPTAASTTNTRTQPPSASRFDSVVPEGKTTAAAATTFVDEPTPTDVINALREKLLLEKADAYVRSLEQQKREEDQLHLEKEEQMQSHKHAEILMLLTRLRENDHEMLEALYEIVTQPAEVELPDLAHAEEPKQSSPAPPPPPLPLPPVVHTTAVLAPNSPRFPLGVMAAYEMDGKRQTQPKSCPPDENLRGAPEMPPSNLFAPSTSQNVAAATLPPTPPPLPPPNLPEANSPNVVDGTMKAWVDKYFGSTLDPQHRALLQHVLLSREAELQRVAAAESQCRELEAQLVAAKGLGHVKAVSEVPHELPNQRQQYRDSELARALALLHAKEEELIALRKVQAEQEAKLAELKQSLQLHAATNAEPSRKLKYEDELSHWKSRCAATEEQQQFSARRLTELQAYIDRLRTEAQQAVVNIASSSASPQHPPPPPPPPLPLPPPVDATTVQLSSLSGSRPTCCMETATPHSSVSTASPPSGQSRIFSPHMAGGVFAPTPQPPNPSVRLQDAARPPSNVVAPTASDATRAFALQQLREELDMECGRFVSETQRWNQYVKDQEKRWAQLHQR